MIDALQSLRDLPGVMGAFVIDEAGTLCARDLPSWFDDGALMEAGVRLASMRSAIASLAPDQPFEGCIARFGDHLVVMRAVGSGSLCVLCPETVDRRALHMGVSLVARRLFTSARRTSEPPPMPARSSAPPPAPTRPSYTPTFVQAPSPPAPAAPVAGQAPPRRFFRGRPVD